MISDACPASVTTPPTPSHRSRSRRASRYWTRTWDEYWHERWRTVGYGLSRLVPSLTNSCRGATSRRSIRPCSTWALSSARRHRYARGAPSRAPVGGVSRVATIRHRAALASRAPSRPLRGLTVRFGVAYSRTSARSIRRRPSSPPTSWTLNRPDWRACSTGSSVMVWSKCAEEEHASPATSARGMSRWRGARRRDARGARNDRHP